jgi:hypothetical protein
MAHDSEVEFAGLSTRKGTLWASSRVIEGDGVESWAGSTEKEGEEFEVSKSLVVGEGVLDGGAGA